MGKWTIKGQEYALNTCFRGQSAKTLYLAIGTATGLTENSTSITETTDTAYVRQALNTANFSVPAQNASSQTEIATTADYTFPAWAANQATALASIGVYDALTGGNLLFVHELTTPITPVAGQAVKVPSGQLKLNLDSL